MSQRRPVSLPASLPQSTWNAPCPPLQVPPILLRSKVGSVNVSRISDRAQAPGDILILCSVGGKGPLTDVAALGSHFKPLPCGFGGEQTVRALLITQNKRPNED